jgi:predicted RecA/RadA family phage recombinase
MAKNFHHPGDVMTITSAGAVTAGSLVLQGSLAGVALNGATGAGQDVNIALTGVFSLPKTGSQAWAIGAPIYWTGTAATTTASTNKMIGSAWEIVAGGAGDTIGKVRLNGGVVTA